MDKQLRLNINFTHLYYTILLFFKFCQCQNNHNMCTYLGQLKIDFLSSKLLPANELPKQKRQKNCYTICPAKNCRPLAHRSNQKLTCQNSQQHHSISVTYLYVQLYSFSQSYLFVFLLPNSFLYQVSAVFAISHSLTTQNKLGEKLVTQKNHHLLQFLFFCRHRFV